MVCVVRGEGWGGKGSSDVGRWWCDAGAWVKVIDSMHTGSINGILVRGMWWCLM